MKHLLRILLIAITLPACTSPQTGNGTGTEEKKKTSFLDDIDPSYPRRQGFKDPYFR